MKQLQILFNRFKIYINNSIWLLIGLVLRTLIAIFIVSKIANEIGTEDFGWYNLAISVFTVLYAVSTLGFDSSFLIKHYVKGNYTPSTIIGTALYSRIIAAILILIGLSLWIFIAGNETNYWVIVIASFSILFQSSEVIKSYYQWKLKAKVYVSISAITLIIESIFLIYGLYKGFGLFYFMIIYTLERLLILIGLFFKINSEIKLSTIKLDINFLKILLKQSWPLLLGALLTALYARFDQLLIKYFLSIEDLGIYGTGIILSQLWLIIPGLIIPVLFPKIAELKHLTDKKRYYDLILFLYGILNYIAIAIIVFIFFFGEFIILTLYGDAYIDSVLILKILIVNIIILFQSHLTSSLMIIEDQEKFLFKIKLVSVITNITLNILFLSTFGVKYAAYSLLISSILSWIVMAFFNKKMTVLLKLNFKSFMMPFYLKKLLK